ncbi:hypothetical protein MKZ38_001631 [Zalerion maritima]|uniref:3-hydroxyisobutyrate dehydrogenase n=1 Tax=Zalerion maritima TaxID=339359 RepID=A0AAD5WT21_9PEZI|nr:hypothetical protein MKZ38_001631 [Zalerion maritima]
MEQPTRLGFIGLGAMGDPMASNLVSRSAKGSQLYIYDVSAIAMKSFAERHPASVVVCSSPREVSRQAVSAPLNTRSLRFSLAHNQHMGQEIVFTMLPEGSHVRSVYLDATTGILNPDMSARLLVDCSTIDIATFRSVAAEVERYGEKTCFYDAPVSGGTLGAEAASLTFMFGCADDGSDARYPLLHDLLSLMGRTIVACGKPGMGLTAKLCNNYCSGLISLATAEALNMGMRAGMDPRVLAHVFANSTAQSTVCDKWNPVPGICPTAPSSKGYKGGFKVQLMAKDFGLAVGLSEEVGAKVLLGQAGLDAYQSASRDPKCRDLDSRVLFRFIGGREDWMDEADVGAAEKQD